MLTADSAGSEGVIVRAGKEGSTWLAFRWWSWSWLMMMTIIDDDDYNWWLIIDDYNQGWQGWTSMYVDCLGNQIWCLKWNIAMQPSNIPNPPYFYKSIIYEVHFITSVNLFWQDTNEVFVLTLLCATLASLGTYFSYYPVLPNVPAFHFHGYLLFYTVHFHRYLLFMGTCFADVHDFHYTGYLLFIILCISIGTCFSCYSALP